MGRVHPTDSSPTVHGVDFGISAETSLMHAGVPPAPSRPAHCTDPSSLPVIHNGDEPVGEPVRRASQSISRCHDQAMVGETHGIWTHAGLKTRSNPPSGRRHSSKEQSALAGQLRGLRQHRCTSNRTCSPGAGSARHVKVTGQE